MLQELGYERYRTPEDMVSDVVAARIRKASVRRVPTHIERASTNPRLPTRPEARPTDAMAQLVPGVTRAPPSPKHNGSGPSDATLKAEWQALEAAKSALEAERKALHAERASLESDRAGLEAERAELKAQQEVLDGARVAFEEARATAADALGGQAAFEEGGTPSMMEMFDGRGLKGVDEAERALAALAGAKAMGRLLEQVKVREPDALRRLLWERLVLVGGPDVPEELDMPSVIVSQERADIPGAFELTRRCGALGEQLMLHGIVRVVMVGIPRRWHSLLRNRMDPRITLGFRPHPVAPGSLRRSADGKRWALVPAPGEAALADPAGGVEAPIDALLVWIEGGHTSELAALLETSRTRLIEGRGGDLAGWLEQVTVAVSTQRSA